MRDHFRYAHIELPLLGHHNLHMEVHCVARMGHVWAPTLICMDYNRCIDQWARDTRDDEAMLLLANKDPVIGQFTGGGLTVYVDDVSRMVPERPQEAFEVLEARTHKVESGLQECLADQGYAINMGNTHYVAGLFGNGAHGFIRRTARGDSMLSGVLCRQARCLGPQLSSRRALRVELAYRLRALWFAKMPQQVLRLLIIAFLQGALLSGMTVYKMELGAARTMDKHLARYLRAALKGKACDKKEDQDSVQ